MASGIWAASPSLTERCSANGPPIPFTGPVRRRSSAIFRLSGGDRRCRPGVVTKGGRSAWVRAAVRMQDHRRAFLGEFEAEAREGIEHALHRLALDHGRVAGPRGELEANQQGVV